MKDVGEIEFNLKVFRKTQNIDKKCMSQQAYYASGIKR
jgi:hypothetical protein